MEKTAQVTFRLPESLKASAIKAAKADSRELSGWLVKVITDAVAADARMAAQRQHFQGNAPAAPNTGKKKI